MNFHLRKMKSIQTLCLIVLVLRSQNAAANQCQNLVPGIERMSRGIDITTLDLFPADLLTPNGFKNGLFNFTCNLNLTWKHPTIANYYYALPDQISVINTVPGGALKIKTHFYEDTDEYKESLSAQLGFSVKFGFFGSFSASASYKQAQEQMLKTNKSVSETSAYISAVQIDFKSSGEMQANQKFVNFITKLLPNKYENGIELYDEFVETFGTHYFESGLFGGYLYQKTIIENEYMRKTSKEELSASIKAKFLGFTAQTGMHSSTSRESESFSSNTETSFYYYGGITDLTNHEDNSYLSRWWNTVPRDPWLFSGHLKPIEDLIKNENIRNQVKKAIRIKRTRAYLSELKTALYLSKIKLSNQQSLDIKNFEKFLANPRSSEFDVDKMGDDIEKLFARVKEIRDRALLSELQQKLWDTYRLILTCKEEMVDQCSTKLRNEVKQQIETRKLVYSQIHAILSSSARPDHKETQELIRDVSKFVQYQETELVDFCGADSNCKTCVKNRINYWYGRSSCSNHAVWKIFQCSPFKC